METDNYSIYRITLVISITMSIMSFLMMPMLRRESGEFVITTLSLIINLAVITFIVVKLNYVRKKAKNK